MNEGELWAAIVHHRAHGNLHDRLTEDDGGIRRCVRAGPSATSPRISPCTWWGIGTAVRFALAVAGVDEVVGDRGGGVVGRWGIVPRPVTVRHLVPAGCTAS